MARSSCDTLQQKQHIFSRKWHYDPRYKFEFLAPLTNSRKVIRTLKLHTWKYRRKSSFNINYFGEGTHIVTLFSRVMMDPHQSAQCP